MNRRPLGMGRAALLVSGSILASRLLGLLRNTLLASTLGVSAEGDLYQYAFALPDLLNYLLAGGFLAITFIPMLTRRMVAGRPQAVWEAYTAVARVLVPAIILLTAIAMILARPICELLYPGLPAEEVRQVAALTRLVLPAQVFFVYGGLLMAVQYANRRFLYPALAPVIYNLGIIVGGSLDASPRGFLVGAVVGAFAGNFALQWMGAHRLGMRWVRGVEWRHPAVPEYFKLAFPLMIGLSIAVLDEQFPRWFGPATGAGGAAALTLARQLNMVPVGLLAQAAGVAAFPFLARLAEEATLDAFKTTTVRAIRTGLVVSSLVAAVLVAVAQPAVRLFYQYGEFSAADTDLVAGLLAIYAISIPAWTAHQLYGRALYAQRRMWSPVLIGTAFAVIGFGLAWWLAKGQGPSGVALASVFSISGYALALGAYWHRRHAWEGASRVGRTLLTVAIAAVAAGAAGSWVAGSDFGSDWFGSFIALGIGTVATVAVWAGVAFLVARSDLSELLRRR